MREDLVIVRAGDASRHEHWPGLAARNWDLAVSYYGATPERFRRPDVPVFPREGGKLESAYDLLTEHPELWRSRRAVLLADDDIEVEAAAVDALFGFRARCGFGLVQLAVDPKSFVTVPLTAQAPAGEHRRTNFVEVMAPAFSTALLTELLPWFRDLRFGWGLDFIWGHVAARHGGAAILDRYTMKHTRKPGTGPLYCKGDPKDEARKTIARSRLKVVVPGVLR